MAYSELVKNLGHTRDFMRDFYIYGFKSREEYDKKSLRSYDDEKRRLESWLTDFCSFRRNADGKVSFISIDSRGVRHNPFFKAWKTKSFTAGDITLHFILFDILAEAEAPLSLTEITERADRDYLSRFESPMLLDESTVRKKLKEYEGEGLIKIAKEGKRSVYSLNRDCSLDPQRDMLHFFSEVTPCGVIGSFILDKTDGEDELFAFKHHYMTGAIDSGILCSLFEAITERRYAEILTVTGRRSTPKRSTVLPLRIFISVQNGRQYLLAWYPAGKCIKPLRLDYISEVTQGDGCPDFELYLERLEGMRAHMWGVNAESGRNAPLHLDFTVYASDSEDYIYRRLLREKRCGRVEVINKNTYRFSAEVYDLSETVPWIRTFICRIVDINMDDKELEAKFKRDIRKMYTMYGIGGDTDAL